MLLLPLGLTPKGEKNHKKKFCNGHVVLQSVGKCLIRRCVMYVWCMRGWPKPETQWEAIHLYSAAKGFGGVLVEERVHGRHGTTCHT